MLGGSHRLHSRTLSLGEKPCKFYRESNEAFQASVPAKSSRSPTKLAEKTIRDGQSELQSIHPNKSTVMRVWAVSDVHADYRENMEW